MSKHYCIDNDNEQCRMINRLEFLLDKIQESRILHGEDPENKDQIDSEIIAMFDKFDDEHYALAESMLD